MGKDDIHIRQADVNESALLIIDVINPFEFENWQASVDRAIAIGPALHALKQRAQTSKVPVIYVNDNFGQWRSNADRLVEFCRTQGNAKDLVQELAPDDEDYFVLKPMHSGFYETPLSLLLRALGAHRLVLTGLWTNSCVLFTAHDAYMRNFELIIPQDCVAAATDEDQSYALNQMRTILKAEISLSRDVVLRHPR